MNACPHATTLAAYARFGHALAERCALTSALLRRSTTCRQADAPSSSRRGQQPELGRDRLDAQLHQELQLVRRLVLLHPADNGGLRPLRLGPVGVRDGLDEELDVAALPIPHLRPDRSSVTDVEDGILGEARAERL